MGHVIKRGGVMMEAVRHIIDSSVLDAVISLPASLRHKKVEIIVMPTAEESSIPVMSASMLDDMLEGSLTQSLLGSVPHSDISLDEIKAERLAKYEHSL
jgi:hypothetical protein